MTERVDEDDAPPALHLSTLRGMFRPSMRHPTRIWSLGLLLCLGCGRPATESECNEIVTQVATLEYQAARKVDGPVDLGSIETIRARVKGAMLKNCVGKRITDKAMRCVRQAKSAQEVQEACFN